MITEKQLQNSRERVRRAITAFRLRPSTKTRKRLDAAYKNEQKVAEEFMKQ